MIDSFLIYEGRTCIICYCTQFDLLKICFRTDSIPNKTPTSNSASRHPIHARCTSFLIVNSRRPRHRCALHYCARCIPSSSHSAALHRTATTTNKKKNVFGQPRKRKDNATVTVGRCKVCSDRLARCYDAIACARCIFVTELCPHHIYTCRVRKDPMKFPRDGEGVCCSTFLARRASRGLSLSAYIITLNMHSRESNAARQRKMSAHARLRVVAFEGEPVCFFFSYIIDGADAPFD